MKASIRSSSLSRSQPIFQTCLNSRSIAPAHRFLIPSVPSKFSQTRSIFGIFRRKRLENAEGVPMSVADLLSKKPSAEEQPTARPAYKRGELASSSIFEKEESGKASTEEGETASPILKRALNREARLKEGGIYPNEDTFMRKYRIRMIKRRGRLSRTEQLMRSEKEHLAKSHNFKTSLKKLGPLARQIAGKPLEHVLTQMRFSPKKAAKDIYEHLKHARDEAVYTKGFDPAQTYIAQAWVGRGTPDRAPLIRARSRIDVMVKPFTSISVILKENKTLERLAREKEDKKKRQKVWVPMPNRPIYGQHQYYTW